MRRRFVGARRLLFRDCAAARLAPPMRTTPWPHPPRGGHSARAGDVAVVGFAGSGPVPGASAVGFPPAGGIAMSVDRSSLDDGCPGASGWRICATTGRGRVCCRVDLALTKRAPRSLVHEGAATVNAKIHPPAGPGKRRPSNRPHKNRHRRRWPLIIRCPWRRPFLVPGQPDPCLSAQPWASKSSLRRTKADLAGLATQRRAGEDCDVTWDANGRRHPDARSTAL